MRCICGAVVAGVEWLCDGKREDENEIQRAVSFVLRSFWLRLLPLMTRRVARRDYGTGLVGCLNARKICCCFGDCQWVRSVALSVRRVFGRRFFASGMDFL